MWNFQLLRCAWILIFDFSRLETTLSLFFSCISKRCGVRLPSFWLSVLSILVFDCCFSCQNASFARFRRCYASQIWFFDFASTTVSSSLLLFRLSSSNPRLSLSYLFIIILITAKTKRKKRCGSSFGRIWVSRSCDLIQISLSLLSFLKKI